MKTKSFQKTLKALKYPDFLKRKIKTLPQLEVQSALAEG